MTIESSAPETGVVPRVTLADVAARAGVSASTASLAFSGSGPVSDATKERVFAAAAELGYGGPDPRARSLRRGRSGIVGVVLEERVRAAFLDPVKIQTLDGLTEGIAPLKAGLLLLTDTGDDEAPVSIDTAPLDAVVLIGCSPRFQRQVESLQRRGIPIVAIEGAPGGAIPEITIDNRAATRLGAEHLRDLGHTDVATVTLPFEPTRTRGALTTEMESTATVDTSVERLRGARDVFPDVRVQVGAASSIEEGLEAGRAILADAATRPTAVIAQSDLLAAGVIQAAEELGLRVPEDVSVIGFDGIRVDGLQHDLTTLVQPSVAKGRAAGEAIVRMLSGEPAAGTDFTSTLHVGETTAPPRA
ncbi:DNA-binding LacI/PurR family transcriptional regulator [Agromyces flavus]|uniref:DNA-binding LacI/PurR family transcriptional regulator n=1 Tax=Agromyces flavus TaxID=589382 RepID=A0A1H1YLE2_9MICO|nr:LacI family DNA-binding transcriptional regulator [Agromyces flavus]MCP2366732.1 DNA-binding LacI/PurR family transcriptional regulator [Agromyces flavus]GGI45261.1 transcriptional regulator [Agromyces flavus]SDT22273.1 DNA-binding transcriptional regulator, LacI/PurR family [Agromyces flavus]